MKRTGRTPTPEIVAAVANLHTGNYTATAVVLASCGIRTSPATVHDVLVSRPGALSVRTENAWRNALGMPLLTILAPACPTCGGACVYDCGTQRVIPKSRTRPARRRVRIDVTGLSAEQRQQVAALIASLRGDKPVTETGAL